uniref:Uncharacterized protein n=1 Tax=Timema bartmani TaxID=61472 RepID=A0A7R9F2Q1_9NEOP|nr:unnamed protein product [Timema bartmani]
MEWASFAYETGPFHSISAVKLKKSSTEHEGTLPQPKRPRTAEDFLLFCQYILDYVNYDETKTEEVVVEKTENSIGDDESSPNSVKSESAISSATEDDRKSSDTDSGKNYSDIDTGRVAESSLSSVFRPKISPLCIWPRDIGCWGFPHDSIMIQSGLSELKYMEPSAPSYSSISVSCARSQVWLALSFSEQGRISDFITLPAACPIATAMATTPIMMKTRMIWSHVTVQSHLLAGP